MVNTFERPAENVDTIYYRDGVSNTVGMHLLKMARRNMFNLFMQTMSPNSASTIIDIGVSDKENEGANFLEKSYPWPSQITCAGIGHGDEIVKRYPVKFKSISPNEPLPFADKSFDIATSNAVLEHVGGTRERQRFILEHLRVAKRVFITVPNRWFPIEHHTSIPLMHFYPTLFRRILRTGSKQYWANPSNMDFLSRSLLIQEWPSERRPKFVMTGLRLGVLSSNIAIIAG